MASIRGIRLSSAEVQAQDKQKITPFLWFDKEAEEAANYYVSIFPNAKIKSIVKYPKAAEKVSGQKAGSVMTVELETEGMTFTFLNGGKIPNFDLNSSAVSFVISCDTQKEIDHFGINSPQFLTWSSADGAGINSE